MKFQRVHVSVCCDQRGLYFYYYFFRTNPFIQYGNRFGHRGREITLIDQLHFARRDHTLGRQFFDTRKDAFRDFSIFGGLLQYKQ